MKKFNYLFFIVCLAFLAMPLTGTAIDNEKPVHPDTPFWQDYSIKYFYNQPGVILQKVVSDRNGNIQVLSSAGLLHPHDGQFLYPGELRTDNRHRPMADKNIADLMVLDQQLVYFDDEAVLSNAWSGRLFSRHQMPRANIFAGTSDFVFLLSDGRELKCIKDLEQLWRGRIREGIKDIKYTPATDKFWILTEKSLSTFSPETKELKTVFTGNGLTSFDVVAYGSKTIIGTGNGYIEINNLNQRQIGEVRRNLPVTEITDVKEVNGKVWFGSPLGAFMLQDDGKYKYYYGERWFPGNHVINIAEGPGNSVLILTDNGLGQIVFENMTLKKG